jgi:EAL domain-containing protein (putative c-di-GMP-specific phosphodiesterase class I)
LAVALILFRIPATLAAASSYRRRWWKGLSIERRPGFARGIEIDFTKQHLVRSMVAMCGQLHVKVIAEGVETRAERAMLLSLGCDLIQGYLYARPERGFVTPALN